MKAVVAGVADPSLDPEARWLARSLAIADHEVVVVGAPAAEPELLEADLVGIPWRWPVGGGAAGAVAAPAASASAQPVWAKPAASAASSATASRVEVVIVGCAVVSGIAL